jgi:hypothetical protein
MELITRPIEKSAKANTATLRLITQPIQKSSKANTATLP